MKNRFNLDDWILDKSTPVTKTLANISISFVYPDYHQFIGLKPKERIKEIDKYHSDNLGRLIDLGLFDTYTITGTAKRPTGIETKMMLGHLKKLGKLDFINVRLISIDNATRVEKDAAAIDTFFCVKMTVAIEIENSKSKKQDREQRFVLIKANSFEDAYAKMENRKDDYAQPYLNSDGRLVRWQIESLDDCFDVGAIKCADLNNPNGIEVFSKIKTRKKRSFWNGES